MTKSLLGGSAAAALLSASLIFYAQPSIAEPLAQTSQEPQQEQISDLPSVAALSEPEQPTAVYPSAVAGGRLNEAKESINKMPGLKPPSDEIVESMAVGVTPPQAFIATAYSLRGRTASGRYVTRGLIAADRSVLPLGTRVRLDAGGYSGEYLVADTGGAIRGRRIDIWIPTNGEALRFGRRTVKLTVLKYGGRRGARRPAARRSEGH